MIVNKSYYEDEVRDGFYIPGIMKRAWAASVEVLEEIDRICNKYDIQYFADAGTLLGAVRHKGFIPWDDDVDVCMVREEYDKFIKVAEEEFKESEWFSIINIHTEEEYDQLFSRVVTGKRINFSKEYLKRFHDFPFVVGVDVFPLDYIAKNDDDESVRCEVVKIVDGIINNIKDINESVKNGNIQEIQAEEIVEELVSQVESLCKIKIDRQKNVINQMYLINERLITMYKSQEADEIALMPVWIDSGGNKFRKKYYEKAISMPFEKIKIRVPEMYDSILREKYGDYMKLVHNWDFHDYPFYGDQIKFFEDKTGIKYPEYVPDSENVCNEENCEYSIKNHRDLNLYYKKIIKSVLKKLYIIRAKFENGEDIKSIIVECQNEIIELGTTLESINEEYNSIALIENWCEKIYSLYVAVENDISQKEKIINVIYELENELVKVRTEIDGEVNIRREVLFLAYKPSQWKYLEPFWRKEMDDDCDVYVVKMPRYYKNALLVVEDIVEEEMNYPDYVHISDADTYDFISRKPDVIYIQSPYDEYNLITTVDSVFYSSNLRKYTPELVYVPGFKTDEIDSEDMRAYYNMQYYISMPGVVNADKVIVNSENKRIMYINYLCDFIGEKYRDILSKKVIDINSVLESKYLDDKEEIMIPEEWKKIVIKENGERKKIILYDIEIVSLLEKKELYIEKVYRVLDIFKEKSNYITTLITMYIPEGMATDEHDKYMVENLNTVLISYCEQGYGILINDDTDIKLEKVCDAYYGDSGAMVQRFRNEKKPIMLQNVEV